MCAWGGGSGAVGVEVGLYLHRKKRDGDRFDSGCFFSYFFGTCFALDGGFILQTLALGKLGGGKFA